MEFYIKNEAGEFVDGKDAVEEHFKERSHAIVSERLKKVREQEAEKIRAEITEDVRKSATESLRGEIRSEIETEYKDKYSQLEKEKNDLSTTLRRKTIAAEYGLKPEAEQFLGDGSDDDMRKNADVIKSGLFMEKATNFPDKTSGDQMSDIQKKTGLDIVI